MGVRVKICCIANLGEAELAIEAGASALGLVSAMPSGPGEIPEQEIGAIAARVPPGIASFLLTCRQQADEILAQHAVCRTTTLQLVDRVEPDQLAILRRELPGIQLVQVIHVTGPESVDQAQSIAPHVDALLLDSGNPQLPVKELGGTGRTHDWEVSATIRERCYRPVYLAGGLHADNVAAAIAAVRPFGVDLCSGLRSRERLDPEKVAEFFAAVG